MIRFSKFTNSNVLKCFAHNFGNLDLLKQKCISPLMHQLALPSPIHAPFQTVGLILNIMK